MTTDKRWGDHSDGRETGHQRSEDVVLAALDKIEELSARIKELEEQIKTLTKTA